MVNYYKGRHFLDVRNKLIMVMLFDTGMRCSKLCELKVTDVQSNVINIQEGKGKKQRHVPITSAVAKYLMKYQLVRQCKYYPYCEYQNKTDPDDIHAKRLFCSAVYFKWCAG